ncbi:MAG: hypothetical protein AAGA90_06300 [Actinomycetota bacterium]
MPEPHDAARPGPLTRLRRGAADGFVTGACAGIEANVVLLAGSVLFVFAGARDGVASWLILLLVFGTAVAATIGATCGLVCGGALGLLDRRDWAGVVFVGVCTAFPLALVWFAGGGSTGAAAGTVVLIAPAMLIGRRAADRYRDRTEPVSMDYLFERR